MEIKDIEDFQLHSNVSEMGLPLGWPLCIKPKRQIDENELTSMEHNDCLYIIPSVDKPIKIVFEGPPIEDNEDMIFTIKRHATLAEIAKLFDMTVDELINTKFGIYQLE